MPYSTRQLTARSAFHEHNVNTHLTNNHTHFPCDRSAAACRMAAPNSHCSTKNANGDGNEFAELNLNAKIGISTGASCASTPRRRLGAPAGRCNPQATPIVNVPIRRLRVHQRLIRRSTMPPAHDATQNGARDKRTALQTSA